MWDIGAYSAAVIYFAVNTGVDKGKPQRRRSFLEELALDMIQPAIDRRRPAEIELQLEPAATYKRKGSDVLNARELMIGKPQKSVVRAVHLYAKCIPAWSVDLHASSG